MSDEMTEGYVDGRNLNNPMPGDNRSEAYVHGFLNGRDDAKGSPRASAAWLRKGAERITTPNTFNDEVKE